MVLFVRSEDPYPVGDLRQQMEILKLGNKDQVRMRQWKHKVA